MPSGLLTLFSITGDNLSPSPEGMKSLILPFEFVVFLGYVVLFTSCMGCYLIIRWFKMIDPLTHMSTCPRGEVNLTQTPGLPTPPCLNRSLCLVLNKNTKLIHLDMPVESRATKSFSSLLPKKKKKRQITSLKGFVQTTMEKTFWWSPVQNSAWCCGCECICIRYKSKC